MAKDQNVGKSQLESSNQTQEAGEIHLRYEALFQNTLDGIIIFNYVTDKIIDCNQAAADIFGYSGIEEMIGLGSHDCIPQFDPMFPDIDLHHYMAIENHQVHEGKAFSSKGIFIGFEGKRILFKANVVPTFYSPGEAFIIFKDVTTAVMNKKALKKSENRYRDVYENSNEGIIYIDSKSLDIIMCNTNALKLFGAKDIQEFREIDATYFFTDDHSSSYSNRKFYIQIIRKALKDGRSKFSFWLKNLLDDHIRVEGVMTSDNSNRKNPRLIAFVRNVTDLYETQSALFQKNEELKDYITSNLQLENFAYLASHDLKTPLRSIISFTQLLEQRLDGRLTESERQLFDYIQTSGKSMGDIIHQLLEFSKVENEILKRSKVDLELLYNQLLIEMTSEIQDTNAIINFDLSCDAIVADKSKLSQILRNLISNSLKFIPEEKTPIINIKCSEKLSDWLFTVADNGIGIEDQNHDSIFALFKRLHVKEEYEGVGIGLPMTKKIVEQHNGSIWVNSMYGSGATFSFTLAKRI